MDAPAAVDPRVRMQIFFAVLLGLFLAALDQTVVGTALPRIVTDLHGNEIYTWAFTGYLLTATISGPIYGKLSDLFGRRPILLFAIIVFLVGSALCGQAREMWQFVAFRSLQGLGAGALFPVALAVIGDLFEPSERGKYQGFFGATFGVSSLVGPAIGGIITDTVGWPWVFYVNLPVGFVVFAVIWRLLPRTRPAGARPRIDYLGAALLVAALVPILIGLTNKQTADWADPSVGALIAVGLAIAAVLVVVEARVTEPIVPVRLFGVRTFAVAVIAMFVVALGLFLLSGLRADTPLPLLYVWMFITGLGVGPMFAVLTLIVQASVAPRQIGTATSSLTLFQQIGGSVGLAITGSIFTSRLLEEIPRQLATSGVPPLIPQIVAAIHRAFSLAADDTFAFGAFAAIAAFITLTLLRESPLKKRTEATAATAPVPAD